MKNYSRLLSEHCSCEWFLKCYLLWPSCFFIIDDKDLSHYKVGDGAKLFLMLKKPGSGVTPSTSSTPSSSKSVPQTPTTFPRTTEQEVPPFTIEHDPTGFWEKLTTFLKRHFTEKDALKVLQVFKKVAFLHAFTLTVSPSKQPQKSAMFMTDLDF